MSDFGFPGASLFFFFFLGWLIPIPFSPTIALFSKTGSVSMGVQRFSTKQDS